MGFSRVLFVSLPSVSSPIIRGSLVWGYLQGMCVQGVCMSVFILCSYEDPQGTSCPPERLLACGKSHTFGISLNRSHHVFFPLEKEFRIGK